MRLDQALVVRGLCESRQVAQECIEKGYVLLNNVVCIKKTRLVEAADSIVVTQKRKFVSRGGDKLEQAILHIYPRVTKNIFKNKSALDIGSSTGGFTDCLLVYGVTHVTAIDVGTSQLHSTLQKNSRVSLFENTDIRDYITDQHFDIIVADLSFIALEKVIDAIIFFGHTETEYFLLIKPQFEVGFGNTKKGIVKDATLVTVILAKYNQFFRNKNYHKVEIFPCALKGGDGNQEYFIYAKK